MLCTPSIRALRQIFLLFAATAGLVHSAEISYHDTIKPILDNKCVACHACFDAPCQLVLSHYDGLVRGANKQAVYDALRITPGTPTRLFIDADTIAAWRELNFFPVLVEPGKAVRKPGILTRLIAMHDSNVFGTNQRLPEDIGFGMQRSNMCTTDEELDDYRESRPHGGMPLGAPGLTASERAALLDWIARGAPYTPARIMPTATEHSAVLRWERFLNKPGTRNQLVSRWLYEHLFMAHLHFLDDGNAHFFRLVRSATPTGKPVQEIATRRPNDDPGRVFHYRLRPVKDTIIYKTHVTFKLDDQLLEQINANFLGGDWKLAHLPDYTDKERANPFATFAAIPAEARYRFMLKHAEYFIRTFIRGPVCHGQIATDVIRDQFWVFFQDPSSDLFITSKKYREKVTPLMDIAGVEQDLLEGAATWFDVKNTYDTYSKLRQDSYEKDTRRGASFLDIWAGDGNNSNALLSVFRHHNSASVTRGLVGAHPLTLWWMDYPLLERGYYNLVVNFDVFGTLAHQAQTRLYFDLIRNDSERNFLRLMPVEARKSIFDDWYQGMAQLKLMTSYQSISDRKSPGISYISNDPLHEFTGRLLSKFAHLDHAADTINRAETPLPGYKRTGDIEQDSRRILRRIASKPASTFKAIDYFPETTFLRIHGADGQFTLYTLLRNRAHTNVAFLLAEDLRRLPEQDTLTVYPGVLSSYPNFIFNVAIEELETFTEHLLKVRDGAAFTRKIVDKWGVRRTHPDFWALFHDANGYLETRFPVEAGIMDMSRYENL